MPEDVRKKAFAFIILRTPDTPPRLLAFRFAALPDYPLRLPGGSLEAGEEPEAGMARELREEAGIERYRLVRLLGVQRYWKPFIGATVERHDFLISVPDLPPGGFAYTVQSDADDNGEVFLYRWITAADLPQLDDEFRQHLTPDYLPELF